MNLYLYIDINLYVHEISILVFFHFPCCFSASLQTFFDRGLRLSLRSCGDQAQLGGRHFSLWSVVGSSFVFFWLGGVEIFRLLIFCVFVCCFLIFCCLIWVVVGCLGFFSFWRRDYEKQAPLRYPLLIGLNQPLGQELVCFQSYLGFGAVI